MTSSRTQLKTSSGWFAAGAEVQRAATLLSDGAFKLFVWLCLHAERDRGSLRISPRDLAAAIRKTEGDIRICLEELAQGGVCRCDPTDLILIQDRFWPYTRTSPPADTDKSEAYVAEVRRMFLSRQCVRSSFTPADHRIAAHWHDSDVSLQRAERAILLGCLRKYVTLINERSATPITTLGYFRSLIDEVSQINLSSGYWQYVTMRLAHLESRWCRQHGQAGRKPREPETK